MNIAYLACPYSHHDPRMKAWRHQVANQVAFDLIKQGIFVYSPLTHNIPLNQMGIHGNWQTWKAFDHAMLSRCDRLIVIKIDGWEESIGVTEEIAFAKENNIPVEWMEPNLIYNLN